MNHKGVYNAPIFVVVIAADVVIAVVVIIAVVAPPVLLGGNAITMIAIKFKMQSNTIIAIANA